MSLLWNHLLFGKAGGGIFVLGFNLSQGVIMRKEATRCAHPICPAGAYCASPSHYLADVQKPMGPTLNRCADLCRNNALGRCAPDICRIGTMIKKKKPEAKLPLCAIPNSALYFSTYLYTSACRSQCCPFPPKSHPLNLLPDYRCTHLPCSPPGMQP